VRTEVRDPAIQGMQTKVCDPAVRDPAIQGMQTKVCDPAIRRSAIRRSGDPGHAD
jgi:hypothetical protein